MALPITGQRWASSCSFDRAPPQGEEATRADSTAGLASMASVEPSRAAPEDEREAVDRARRVAGEAFFKNGHTALDWRRTASMVSNLNNDLLPGRGRIVDDETGVEQS